MADFNQFGSAKPGLPGDPQHCAQCEAMLADALDGTLSDADQAMFDLHMAGCSACAAMLADAQRGAAWLEMLKFPQPEPPLALIERILAETSGQPAIRTSASSSTVPAASATVRNPNTLLGSPMLAPSYAGTRQTAAFATNVLPFRSRFTHGLRSLGHTMLQPRLAMTAAMAFFSIALTLNLTGVRLSSLRASDLKPSSILRTCYATKARVVRYSDNLRVVYELESRVRDLQHSPDDDNSTSSGQQSGATQQPASQKPADKNPDTRHPDQKQSRPRPNPGSSRREVPVGNLLRVQTAQRRGSTLAPMQAFAVFPPSIYKIYKQEGGLV